MQRLLVTGPPASGKTHWIRERVHAALVERREDWRLLVPTTTMADHIRNQMAREGFAFRPRMISTIAGFAAEMGESRSEISDGVLSLLAHEALERLRVPEYERVREFPGFRRAVAAVLREANDAGVSPNRLPRAVATVYREVERIAAERGLVFGDKPLGRVISRIARYGLGRTREVLIDGFFRLGALELELVSVLTSHADVTVTLPDERAAEQTRAALTADGFRELRFDVSRRHPREQVTESPTMTQEVEEIARAICEEAGRGRPFREIGVILRSRDPYLAALETAFERFGIPARCYFALSLNTHVSARYWRAAVQAQSSGWDHEKTLAVLRMAAAGCNDRFLIEARKLIPGSGLDPLRRLAADSVTLQSLDRLAELDVWGPEKPAMPDEWAVRIRAKSPELREPLAETAAAMAALPVTLETYWSRVEEVLAATPRRTEDRRREVVHVMDVFEARQWELSVVFVCGMIERHFPRYHTGDPLVPELVRKALGLVTAEEKQEQERSHFAIARSRAVDRVVFSYPRFDAKGAENLRSFFLGENPELTTARSVRPAARSPKTIPRPGTIGTPDLLARIGEQHAVLSATRIEDFLQCPFRFFARRTLCVEPSPCGPEERFDARVQGRLVHEFIEAWRPGMFVDTVFDSIFEEHRSRENLGHGWRTELVRIWLLRDLRRWTHEYSIANGAEFEKRFRIRVAGKQVRGRIDCVEPGGGRLVTVTDFKYSANTAAYVKAHEAGLRVQAGLYVLAAKHQFEREVAAMFFVGLREESLRRKGWNSPRELEELVCRTEELTQQAAEGIAAGEISVRPADAEACIRCDFREACRVEEVSISRRAGQ